MKLNALAKQTGKRKSEGAQSQAPSPLVCQAFSDYQMNFKPNWMMRFPPLNWRAFKNELPLVTLA